MKRHRLPSSGLIPENAPASTEIRFPEYAGNHDSRPLKEDAP